MTNQKQDRNSTIGTWALSAALVLPFLTIVLATQLHAQTFTVLHAFNGGSDGGIPYAGLTMDRQGRLYGTTQNNVYRMTRQGAGWVIAPLYHFSGGGDGGSPEAGVAFGPDGTLYGTTQYGGQGEGVVYNLRLPPTACPSFLCAWTETVLHTFTGFDGYNLDYGDLVFDPQGNLYGTAEIQGDGCLGGEDDKLNKMPSKSCSDGDGPPCGGAFGNVYQMTPGAGGWTRKAVYSFTGFPDGAQPTSGVILDSAGNLYGTASAGGNLSTGAGVVFQMTPGSSCYKETVLYSFTDGSDGRYPVAGLVRDAAGNLYGATSQHGSAGGGTIFELVPSSGGWTFQLLCSLTGSGAFAGPLRSLSLDTAGNLYGTTYAGGAYGYGSVFKLTPGNGTWTYTALHDFTNGNDGAFPYSNVLIDSNGNLYGTASKAGASGLGVIWEITQ